MYVMKHKLQNIRDQTEAGSHSLLSLCLSLFATFILSESLGTRLAYDVPAISDSFAYMQ